jgi:hypothetical protein
VTGPVSTVVAKSCVSSSVTGSLAMSRARSCCHANIRALVSVVKRVPLCAGSAIRTRSLKCSLEMKTSQTQGIVTAHVKKLYCAFFAGSMCTTFHCIGLIVSLYLSSCLNWRTTDGCGCNVIWALCHWKPPQPRIFYGHL